MEKNPGANKQTEKRGRPVFTGSDREKVEENIGMSIKGWKAIVLPL